MPLSQIRVCRINRFDYSSPSSRSILLDDYGRGNASCDNFSYYNFCMQNLRGWNFSCTNLQGARFINSNLSGVILAGANLLGAEFGNTLGIVDAGQDWRGYRFIGVWHRDSPMILAGCRWFTLSAAYGHWSANENQDALFRVALIEEGFALQRKLYHPEAFEYKMLGE